MLIQNLNTGGADFGGIDFSKLGGAAGMGGLDEDEEDEDDDDMPALEGEEEEAAETKAAEETKA